MIGIVPAFSRGRNECHVYVRRRATPVPDSTHGGGSVADPVSRQTDSSEEADEASDQNYCLPYCFSDSSLQALREAVDLAAHFEADIYLLDVISSEDYLCDHDVAIVEQSEEEYISRLYITG